MNWRDDVETVPDEKIVLGWYPIEPEGRQIWCVFRAHGGWYGDHHSSEYGTEKPPPDKWCELPEPPKTQTP